jgi:hypothetical protein
VYRRELFRRTLLGVAGVAAAAPPRAEGRAFPADYNASRDLAWADWKPVFLDDHENETLIILSDLIIPKIDTPSAKESLANRFIDRCWQPQLRRRSAHSSRAWPISTASACRDTVLHSVHSRRKPGGISRLSRLSALAGHVGKRGNRRVSGPRALSPHQGRDLAGVLQFRDSYAGAGVGRAATWGIRRMCPLREFALTGIMPGMLVNIPRRVCLSSGIPYRLGERRIWLSSSYQLGGPL